MQLRVLGPVCVHTEDGRMLTLPRRHERCLLGILLLETGHTVGLSRLADLLWEDEPPLKAPQALRTYAARIRRLLAEIPQVRLVSDRGGYQISADPELVDVCRFRQLVQKATGQPADVREGLLRDALALWQGPVLQHAANDQLRQRLCTDLIEQHLQAQEEHLAARIDLGRYREILPEVAQLATDHPARERLVELHMLVLYRQGRTADALAVYQRARDRLASDLGVDPGPALQQLHRLVLRGEPVPSPDPAVIRLRAAEPVRPAQLPPDVPLFAGRAGAMRQLDRLLTPSGSAAPAICAISGTAGVGKTALAVHWAHRVADQFPDGQLYVNLRGFDPSGQAVDPAIAVRGFLDAFEVPTQRVPADPDSQIALYRSLVAGKRMLIVLDNARDTAQVRPLLPGSSGSVVVLTSRNRLTGLIATNGAYTVDLDLLTQDEAREMLAQRLGADRVAAEPAVADEIVARCARLPLALALVAAHASGRPDTKLRVLADELHSTQQRWEIVTGDDPASDVRAVFACSYDALPPSAARLFRLLGLHPGPDISAAATASLAALSLEQTRSVLADLVAAHLVTESAPDRYTMHDLLRSYAVDLAGHESADTQAAAVDRLLAHYVHTAHTAALLVYPLLGPPITLPPPPAGTTPETLADSDAAMAWFAAEDTVLLAAMSSAAASGADTYAWQLAWALKPFHDRRGRWQDWVRAGEVAVEATRRSGEVSRQGDARRSLAAAYACLRRFDDAHAELRHALDLYRQVENLVGQAAVHHDHAYVFDRQGMYREALEHSEQAGILFCAAGHRRGEASSESAVGWCHAQLGEYQQALTHLHRALTMNRDVGDRDNVAHTYDSIGFVYQRLGELAEAIECFQQALTMFKELGNRVSEATVLTHLGDTRAAAGAIDTARSAWREALVILTELDHPDATQVRNRLARGSDIPAVG